MKRRHLPDDETGINVTPMLDIVFIMLIFFIVTTSFVREQGLEIARPSNVPTEELEQDKGPIVLRIDRSGSISLEGRALERRALEANLERAKADKPSSGLIVAAHPDADTDALVAVLDAARVVGLEPVSVATDSPR